MTTQGCIIISNHYHADVSVSVPAMLSVEEEAGMVEVCVSLSVMEMEETEREFIVTLDTENGTGL